MSDYTIAINHIKQEIATKNLIPYLGMGIFKGAKTLEGEIIPFDSDSLIFAMNEGKPMAPRLMVEFSRAAMYLEQRRGVDYLKQLVAHIYSKPCEPTLWQKKVASFGLPFVVDTNRDTKMQELYSQIPHYLISGRSRIMGDKPRYEIFEYPNENVGYIPIEEEGLSFDKPIIFKPMGTVLPQPSFIISDADYVDWLTEAMGGFAVPSLLKEYRKGKKLLFLGVEFDRDTQRMVANELTLGCEGGWVVYDKEVTKKERKFFDTHHLEVISSSLEEFGSHF